jgi:ubiquitin C-terminal hydrolase
MVKCQNCSYISTTFETFWDLSIPVSPSGSRIFTSVEDCLKEYFKEEFLEALYKCDQCHSHQKATKKLAISRFPVVLVLRKRPLFLLRS